MAIDYHLAIATGASPVAVAALALPDLAVYEAPGLPGLFTADTPDSLGFGVALRAATDGWVSGLIDDGSALDWTPEAYISFGFRMSDGDLGETGLSNVLTAIARILATMTDDLAFRSDDYMYLTRFGGRLVKYHRKDFWDWYEFANAIVPG
jgi:hypothetical protein